MTRMNGNAMAIRDGKAQARKAARKRTRGLSPQQKLALLVGGVGAFVLLLSVWECCTAIHALTGMPLVLAALLAVGVDAGMVCMEMAVVASARGTDSHDWAEKYIWLAVGLSILLNAAAAAAHANGWMKVVAALVGGVVPVLVYMAGRVAGSLWAGK